MRLLISCASWLAQLCYAILKAFVPARHKVVMLSRQADTPSRDFTMLADGLRSRDDTLEVVVRCRFIRPSFLSRVAYVGEILAQMYHLASARACIVDGYVVPVSLLTHRADLTVIQMWHALGAIKEFGYQSLDRPSGRSSALARAMRMHQNYDVVLCGGPATIPIFSAAFDVDPSRVKPLGLPRIDYLLAHSSDARVQPAPASVAALRARHRVLDEGRTVVLYAPTFRRNRPERFREVIERFSADRYAVIVKPHPLVDADFAGGNVVDASTLDILDVLPLADIVITDYSAVAFEAAAIDLPLYFYLWDIEQYRAEHGLNIDPLAEMPLSAFTDIEELGAAIESGGYDQTALERFRDRYVTVADGECTRRIVDLVLDAVAGAAR